MCLGVLARQIHKYGRCHTEAFVINPVKLICNQSKIHTFYKACNATRTKLILMETGQMTLPRWFSQFTWTRIWCESFFLLFLLFSPLLLFFPSSSSSFSLFSFFFCFFLILLTFNQCEFVEFKRIIPLGIQMNPTKIVCLTYSEQCYQNDCANFSTPNYSCAVCNYTDIQLKLRIPRSFH